MDYAFADYSNPKARQIIGLMYRALAVPEESTKTLSKLDSTESVGNGGTIARFLFLRNSKRM